MDEFSRSLHPVPEHDEDTVSALSPSSSRRGATSPESPTSNNPFTHNLFGRSGYQRMPSDTENGQEMANLDDTPSRVSRDVDGLGISNSGKRNSIGRVPVGSKMGSPETPRSFHGLLGTPDTSSLASPAIKLSPQPQIQYHPDLSQPPTSPPLTKSTDTKGQPYTTIWDASLPNTNRSPQQNLYDEHRRERSNSLPLGDTPTLTPALGHPSQNSPGDLDSRNEFHEDDFDDSTFHTKFTEPPSYCYSKKDIHQRRTSWLSWTIYVLSVYSTVMSGIWLVVAILQPRWGHGISSKHGMLPSSATLVTALVSKTIEMSFVTAFISFLGQVLTRRAFIRKAHGMTLAEMTMRNWVFQPGSLITHFETLPYAGLTLLGALSLIATFAAAFFTTASDAMISPKLKYGAWETKELSGYIRASYANVGYVSDTCPSLTDSNDKDHSDESCMNVQFSGQSYRNLLGFMSTWTSINENGTSITTDLAERPPGSTLLYDNTTMTSAWIETEHSNVTAHWTTYGRIINNVTLASPHPGVYAAATLSENGILQPDDLAGVGEYAIRAGVVSPSVNVLCVNMDFDELKPLVYTEWPGDVKINETGVGNQTMGWSGWGEAVPPPVSDDGKENWLNRTVVDDIFQWGPKYKRRPPVFQLYPADYNLITNSSVYLSDSIYIMAKITGQQNYTLCQMRSWLSPNCSTEFSISGTAGASMQAHCEDPKDKNSYLRSYPPDQSWSPPSTDWRWLAEQWRLSMDLNAGAANSNASNARILSQLTLTEPSLPSYLPSIAEALAVYASSVGSIGSMDTPFVHYWEFDKPGNIIGEPGILQPFNASLITQQYTSGHINNWQGIFYVVLVLVFGLNMFSLGYFIMRSGLVTDFTEPQNLFALAINSPPSAQLAGSCGAGPEGRDLVVPWRVAYAPSAHHYFFQEANERPWRGKYANEGVSTARDYGTPRGSSYKRLSSVRGWM
ncbi:hypothetical protein G7046_g905 [Stylonectria norvegica]|nr:hypothetical protein G7046_g905 [Stylonectria norvegica]